MTTELTLSRRHQAVAREIALARIILETDGKALDESALHKRVVQILATLHERVGHILAAHVAHEVAAQTAELQARVKLLECITRDLLRHLKINFKDEESWLVVKARAALADNKVEE